MDALFACGVSRGYERCFYKISLKKILPKKIIKQIDVEGLLAIE